MQLHSELVLEQVWHRPNWSLERFFDPSSPKKPPKFSTDGWIKVEISEELPDIEVDLQIRLSVSVNPEILNPTAVSAGGWVEMRPHNLSNLARFGGINPSFRYFDCDRDRDLH